MGMASPEQLKMLHGVVISELTRKITAGEAKAADLSVAAKMLAVNAVYLTDHIGEKVTHQTTAHRFLEEIEAAGGFPILPEVHEDPAEMGKPTTSLRDEKGKTIETAVAVSAPNEKAVK
ncbi:MAG: hypothetical protein AAF661_05875 [Pseudomonadota bacterium]